jgi:hypothetical protein
MRLGPAGAALAKADSATQAALMQELRAFFAPHATPAGVVMTGATWIVTARA